MAKEPKPCILISDLHVDRWNRERKEHFFEFLDYVEKNAACLYVLGDIFDFPALKGNSIWPKHSEIIMRLRSMPVKGIPLTYMIGNHDISLRGIELDENGFTITYCDTKRPFMREIFGKKVYMDHGHFYDPLFQDHIYDAMEFFRNVTGKAVDQHTVDLWRDMVRIFQRQPKRKPEEEIGVPEHFLKIWESAAEQILKRMRYDIVVFGHTHAPTIVEMLGGSQWYVNTGDWVVHSTFIELSDGKLVLKDWLENKTLKEISWKKG
jgi:UDP-2,3-diacylglucosamine hydrolase